MVKLSLGNQLIEILHAGDYFAEQCVLFNMNSLFTFQAIEKTIVFKIPRDQLRDVPAIRWKLLETHNMRMQFLLDPDLASSSIFEWREEYRTNIKSMDEDHRRLFERADAFYKKLSLKECVDIEELFDFLTNYAEKHFEDEECLMSQYSFPGLERHQIEHRHFFMMLTEIKEHHPNGALQSGMECIKFLRDWVIRHILTVDRQYGIFLNEKGVF
jgi:hemerythrin-like metal-binding protein